MPQLVPPATGWWLVLVWNRPFASRLTVAIASGWMMRSSASRQWSQGVRLQHTSGSGWAGSLGWSDSGDRLAG